MTVTTVWSRLFPADHHLLRDTVSGLLQLWRFCWLISAITHNVAGGCWSSPRFTFSCQAGRSEAGLAADDASCQQEAIFHKGEDGKLQYFVILEWMDGWWEVSRMVFFIIHPTEKNRGEATIQH